jgi:acyl-CoA reductase-like NAD-dependent aldehyde dehydrogenase
VTTTAATAAGYRDEVFIAGGWRPAAGGGRIEVVAATTGEVLGAVAEGGPGDVDAAVAAARAALPGWSATPAEDRAEVLRRVRELLTERQPELAATITTEVGTTIMVSHLVQVGLPAITLSATAAEVGALPPEERIGHSLVTREAVGVVGAITPWNYPLHQLVAKVAPALVAGNTVVAKPSEVAPGSALILADLLAAAGLPAGAFNLVPGYGPVAGEAIATHPGVDMVTFTGSTAAGRRVMQLAAGTVKRVALELGGKSPLVVLDDADLAAAVARSLAACFINNGQTCSALTRLVVPQARLGEVEELLAAFLPFATVGDPFDPASQVGPLVSQRQQDRVRDYIRIGLAEGARLVGGGPDLPSGLERGFYVAPTVLSGVEVGMRVAQEEIFGPVLVVQSYPGSDDDAVRVANSTEYGLAGGVFSADEDRALRVARRLRCGQVEVNGAAFNPVAPFGGYGQSGVGRELGRHGLAEFFQTKAIQLPG